MSLFINSKIKDIGSSRNFLFRYYLDNVTLEKANLSMAYMENALVGPDSHEDCSFAPAVTLEGHGCPKPSMGM